MVADFWKKERLRPVTEWACAVAVILGPLLATGYVAQRVVRANREQRNAFARFGREVVKRAEENGWRYGVLGGDDEGMLLYVRRTEFIEEPLQAAAQWNGGGLDALVAPEDEMGNLLPHLKGAEPKRVLTSGPAGRYRRRYLLLVRSPSS